MKLGEDYNPPMGRKATFTKDEEKEIVAFITLMAEKFYGITQQILNNETCRYISIVDLYCCKIIYLGMERSLGSIFYKRVY